MKVRKLVLFALLAGGYARLTPLLMQPHRVRMAHNLITNYGLTKHMEVFVRLVWLCLDFLFRKGKLAKLTYSPGRGPSSYPRCRSGRGWWTGRS